jgi:fructokinase
VLDCKQHFLFNKHMPNEYLLGIDLGGSKIEAAVLNQQGELCFSHRVATPQGQYAATLDAIAELIHCAEDALHLRFDQVGIGTPGTLSSVTGAIKNSNSVCLNGQPLREDLSQKLAREIRLSNDANCFALSEATDGNAADARSVFGVIIGTGTGGGLVSNGQLITGANGIAGEWGHNPLPWPSPDELDATTCYCGRSGCIETWLSGPGFSRDHEQHSGKLLDAAEIYQLANNGEASCQQSLDRYIDRLARGLAHVINIFDPQVIILGGGLSNMQCLYTEVPKIWSRYIFSDNVLTELRRPKFGDASGVRGAAWLFKP